LSARARGVEREATATVTRRQNQNRHSFDIEDATSRIFRFDRSRWRLHLEAGPRESGRGSATRGSELEGDEETRVIIDFPLDEGFPRRGGIRRARA
jgi:hypothetical protein